MTLNLDLLAFGAHPDDVELVAGGTLLKMAQRGYKTGIVDMTRGERGTRGSPEIRAREARASARILKLRVRENLSMEDAHVAVGQSSRLKVIDALRRFRPRIVITHYWEDPHPDHRATSEIVTDACFLAGLMRIDTGQPRFRPQKILYFMLPSHVLPTLVVDVTDQFEARMRACRAYRSQMYNPRSNELETRLSTPDFLDRIEADHRYFGNLIHTKYGEAFYSREILRIDNPVAFFEGPVKQKGRQG
ncbi:MAG: bacillithiol biosynthesis deacetylase BshB1 [Acidobacteriia bacterium]|nr:bacillithiol biosynthesis deacetylase BshB1 [Terriglobia bacterium]